MRRNEEPPLPKRSSVRKRSGACGSCDGSTATDEREGCFLVVRSTGHRRQPRSLDAGKGGVNQKLALRDNLTPRTVLHDGPERHACDSRVSDLRCEVRVDEQHVKLPIELKKVRVRCPGRVPNTKGAALSAVRAASRTPVVVGHPLVVILRLRVAMMLTCTDFVPVAVHAHVSPY